MHPTIFHINLYDLLFTGAIFVGMTFALLLWFTEKTDKPANRFLALTLAVMLLWLARLLGIDLGRETHTTDWSRQPLLFSLASGPLIFFYVRKITRPAFTFRWKDLLHFIPLLAALFIQSMFLQRNPVLHVLAFISIIAYLYGCQKLVKQFYQGLAFTSGDRYRHGLRWLERLLHAFMLLWVLWILFTALDYFVHPYQINQFAWYPLYVLLIVMVIGMAVLAFVKPGAVMVPAAASFPKPPLSMELKQKGVWLKKIMRDNQYYQDEGLSLHSLAEKLGLGPHELSRIINTTLKKSFKDFINEYRVAEVIRKMNDPANENITLLGIAFESGFNSSTSFHRIFKQMTGKSPAEFKTVGKKEIPSYKPGQYSPAGLLISPANRIVMFKNYTKIAWRHIIRHKTYSAINVMGLSLGICGCLIIWLVASFELSFDTFHRDKERIYCVDEGAAGAPDPEQAHWNAVPAPMPGAMRSEMTGIETVAAFHHYNPKVTITKGEKGMKNFDRTNGIIAEPEYFDILSYTWLSGDKRTALNRPLAVVLTEGRAKTYFGDLRPGEMIGKSITYDDSLTVTVTGILQDWNKNSDFNFSDFVSFPTINSSFLKNQIQPDNWNMLNHGSQELVKLSVGVHPSQINAQFPSFIKKHLDPNPHTKLHLQLQPFTGIHFHREYGGEGQKANLDALYILSAVAVFILLIAAVNFVNLSTAQSIQRTKETGIRKVLGSGSRSILLQFLTETFVLALLAAAIAAIAVRPLLNLFADYIPAGVKFDFTACSTWIFLTGIAVFTTLLAGLYPAMQLSEFRPVTSLKGETSEKIGNKGWLRKSLIVFQFSISLVFIIGTLVTGNQINYMLTRNLGFKTNNIITLRSVWNDHSGKMKVLAQSIRQLPGIEQVITEAFPPMGFAHMGNGMQVQGSNEKPIQASNHSGDENFVPFYNMKIIAGRNIFHSDSVREYLISETAAKSLGFADPQQAIGKLLVTGSQNKPYPIAGVVADFYENTLHQQIMPVFIANEPKEQTGIALKLTPAGYQKGDINLLVNSIAKQWKKIYPEEPFDYSFLGDSIAHMYDSDQQTKWLMGTATLITIFISCMGLFGLAMFTTERRIKEISIRKVLGASAANILALLNKEVAVLVAVSLLIASPISWFFMHRWLRNFAYHTSLNVWVFIMAGAGAMLIALATISFRTIRSATANPVKGLRNE